MSLRAAALKDERGFSAWANRISTQNFRPALREAYCQPIISWRED